jgi:hypothetical protein
VTTSALPPVNPSGVVKRLHISPDRVSAGAPQLAIRHVQNVAAVVRRPVKAAEADHCRIRIDMLDRIAEVARRRDDQIALLQRRLGLACTRTAQVAIRWVVA